MEEDASALDSMLLEEETSMPTPLDSMLLEEEPYMPPPRKGIDRMRRAELIAEVRHERVRCQAMTKRKDEIKAALVTANRLVVDTKRQLREQQSLVQLTITQNDELTQERDALLQQLQQEVAKNEALRQQALEQDISKDAIVSCILQEQVEQMSSFNDTIRKFDKVATDLEQIRESNNCPICISPWTAEGVHRIVSLKCGHLFGESCVRMHLGCSADCPCCKQSAQVKDLRYLFGIPVLYAAPSQNLQNGAAEGEVPNER
ncbi:E3 ubiquitin-protein ligase RFWD3-like [Drosophila teissieri]|uniref:E3 ubiquitin-protein ligase RFWD3-like n=1 Tax=Drosophila teissieri TaxID=7243 RepID=UPI001CBA4F07|nr:E3 ubiquitin-protein ligase RFWD3-like [Drosophila teissieri]XP_043662619.1 E3 ubiquitin-protein ligase RFWD3-like [Drosophila teissieri]